MNASHVIRWRRKGRKPCLYFSSHQELCSMLNFTGLAYMNSSGIGLLVTLLIRINRQKQHLLCSGLSEHYKHIFELTRLSDAIKLYDTEPEALAAAQLL